MAVAAARASDKAAKGQVLIKNAKPQEFVTEDGYYYLTIQLGSGINWRGAEKGKWVRDPDNDGDNAKAYYHRAGITRVGPVSGAIANGIVQTHNDFLQSNDDRESPRGEIAKMVLVTKIEPTTDVPDVETDGGSPFAKSLVAASAAAARETIKELFAAGIIAPTKPAKK